jgi:hypothetical protein
MFEAQQSLRVRCHTVLHIEVPRCWKVGNDSYGGTGAAFLNRRLGRAVILKSDAEELSARIDLNRRLPQLRVHRSE